jgi:voltage-gated potassium channel
VDSSPYHPTGQRPAGSPPVTMPPGVPFRRPVLLSLARAALNATAVVVLYYVLPLNRPVSWRTVGWLVGGLFLVSLLIAGQIRAILRARYPTLRAMEALATSIPLFLVVFAAVYEMLDVGLAGSFSEHMTRTDALYFVVTVFSTVGFGDITATSETARVLVTVQMIGDLVLIGLVIRAFLAAVDHGRQRRQQERSGGIAPGGQ